MILVRTRLCAVALSSLLWGAAADAQQSPPAPVQQSAPDKPVPVDPSPIKPASQKKKGDAAPKAGEKAVPAEVKKAGEQDGAWTPKFSKERFLRYLKQNKASEKILSDFASDWELGADAGITDRALQALKPEYGKAVDLLDAGDPKGALSLVKIIVAADKAGDVHLRAHARYKLARALLDEDDPEGASQLLNDFVAEDRGYSLLDPSAVFFFGYSLSIIPRPREAILNLRIFLELYPDASERYRANAAQLLQELEAQWDSPLHAIADEMKFCERKLKKEQSGKIVETKQLDIVEKLDLLIKQLEEKQQQGGDGAPKGNQPPAGPANRSEIQPGEGRIGKLHGSRGVKDRWGNMKSRDREKILSELQTKLPERYRSLLENYYKRLNKGGR